MQLNNEFDSTTVSESAAPSANGKELDCTEKYFHPYNLRCFLKITPEEVAKMDRFHREVYEKQAENLVAHCEEELDFIANSDDIMKKTEKDIKQLKAGIQALDESIAATNAKIEEINALKSECTAERIACIGVTDKWNRAQESFSANITRILDRLQKEVDAKEGKKRPMRATRTDSVSSRHRQAARDYSNGRQNIRV